MRSVSRVADVSINTVAKLLDEAGRAALSFHDERVRGLQSKRVQCDEIWSFVYAKNKNVVDAKAPPKGAGDVWTWTAIDADSKLICKTLRVTPAMASGLTDKLLSFEDLIAIMDEAAPKPGRPKTYKKRAQA